MTEQQKEEIRKLRVTGFGYKKIAAQLGLTENSVKSFCHRNNLAGRIKPQIPKCKYCGKPISSDAKGKQRTFCSRKCKQDWWNNNRNHPNGTKQVERTCSCCQKVFRTYPSDNRKFCSHYCYIQKRFKGGDIHEQEIT